MNVMDAVKEVLSELTDCCDIEFDSNLKSDLGIDSLSLVAVIVGLEEKLGIAFDDGDLDPSALETVRGLLDLVNKTL